VTYFRQALLRLAAFKKNAMLLSKAAYMMRKTFFIEKIDKREFLKNPEQKGPLNPITDPVAMETMLEGMKKNMTNFIPQTIIMTYVTYFFSGFLLSKVIIKPRVFYIIIRVEYGNDLFSFYFFQKSTS
jgi:hypothetical protein